MHCLNLFMAKKHGKVIHTSVQVMFVILIHGKNIPHVHNRTVDTLGYPSSHGQPLEMMVHVILTVGRTESAARTKL